MLRLQDIESFGGTAAEDDDIKKFFVETPAFKRLVDGKRHVVLGRKGAGKTALYLAVVNAANQRGHLSKGLMFKQYPWQAHYKYAAGEVASTERFIASWTFLILIEAFSLLIDRPPYGLRSHQNRALGEVRRFIEQNYGTIYFDFKQAFPTGGLALDAIEVKPEAAKLSAGSVRVKRSGESLGASLPRVNEWLTEKLRAIGSDATPTYILFDELDLGYKPDDSEYLDRVVGLLLAVRGFVAQVTKSGVPVHPIAFLRSDIFDSLRFGDKNKVLEANALELKWNDDLNYRGASLSHLIDWRVKEALQVSELEDAWGAAFDEQLTRGTQHKFQHMTFRTFLRPRDLIKFANLALESAQARYEDEGGDPRISNVDLKNARVPYSNYFRKELDDEIAEADKSWTALLEVLRSIGAARFDRENFEAGYRAAARKTKLEKSVDECLAFFYHFSIIGFERAIPRAGIIYQFRYQDESVIFDPAAPSFLVHRGLKETLGLTETISSES